MVVGIFIPTTLPRISAEVSGTPGAQPVQTSLLIKQEEDMEDTTCYLPLPQQTSLWDIPSKKQSDCQGAKLLPGELTRLKGSRFPVGLSLRCSIAAAAGRAKGEAMLVHASVSFDFSQRACRERP